MKAIGQCTGRSVAQVRAAAQKAGDLGAAAAQARATQRTMVQPPPLTVRKVFAALREIAHMTGQYCDTILRSSKNSIKFTNYNV